MQVDVSTALAVAAVVFAAGGGWITLARTDRRGAEQGKRIGKLEVQLAALKAEMRARRQRTLPTGIPVTTTGEDPTHGS